MNTLIIYQDSYICDYVNYLKYENNDSLKQYMLANIDHIIVEKKIVEEIKKIVKDIQLHINKDDNFDEFYLNKKLYKINIISKCGQLQYSLTKEIVKKIDILNFILDFPEEKTETFDLEIPIEKYFTTIFNINLLINLKSEKDNNYIGTTYYIQPLIENKEYDKIIEYLKLNYIKLSALNKKTLNILSDYIDYPLLLKIFNENQKIFSNCLPFLNHKKLILLLIDFYYLLDYNIISKIKFTNLSEKSVRTKLFNYKYHIYKYFCRKIYLIDINRNISNIEDNRICSIVKTEYGYNLNYKTKLYKLEGFQDYNVVFLLQMKTSLIFLKCESSICIISINIQECKIVTEFNYESPVMCVFSIKHGNMHYLLEFYRNFCFNSNENKMEEESEQNIYSPIAHETLLNHIKTINSLLK